MTIIETLHFDNYMDMALTVSDKYEKVTNKDKYDSVAVIAKYDNAKEILSILISMDYDIGRIEIYDEIDKGYSDEFIVSLFNNTVWCSPAKDENKYLNLEDDYVYLLDNCNSKIIPRIDAKEVYEVEINEVDDDCDCCCENCDCCHDNNATCKVYVDENDNVTGFSVHKDDEDSHMEFTYYSYGDEFLSEDVIKSILEPFA